MGKVAFYDFPKEHWKHLRTTNIIESPFAAVRLRTDAAKRFKTRANATAKFWRLLLVAEKRFRKIDAPRLASEIHRGGVFEDGVQVTKQNQGPPPEVVYTPLDSSPLLFFKIESLVRPPFPSHLK